MTGIIKVDTIQNNAGTTGLTIASDGKVTGSVNDSRQCVQIFMRTSGIAGNQNPVPGLVDAATQLGGNGVGKITRGGSVTESSGIFSFPFTGLWCVEYYTSINPAAQDDTIQVDIKATLNDTNFAKLAQAKGGAGAAARREVITLKTFFKVSDTSTHKIKFQHSSNSGTAEGATDAAITYAIFTWMGDAD